MNPNDNNDSYNPGEDENQGVVTKLVHGQQANAGVSQAEYMNPMRSQGPESEKAEVNDGDSESESSTGTESNGINDDLLAEETVEAGEADQ